MSTTDKTSQAADLSELDEIQRDLPLTAHGKPRMELLRRAYRIADGLGDYENQIYYRLEYVSETAFYDDIMMIYIVFPELLKLNDEYVAKHGSSPHTDNILWQYKWLLCEADSFYQISREQFEAFSEDFKKRCLREGKTLRAYYQMLFAFYSFIDRKISSESYDDFLREKRDWLSDCEACERNNQICYQMRIGNYEEAERLAQDILSGRLTCTNVPAGTYGKYVRTYNLLRCRNVACEIDFKTVRLYCERVRLVIQRSNICSENIGDVFMFYVLEDKAKALPYYKKYWSDYESNKNPLSKFYFACAAARFFAELGKPAFRMKLPSSFPLYSEDDVYDVAELKKYYQDYAKGCAARFDARNGNTYIGDIYGSLTGDSSC